MAQEAKPDPNSTPQQILAQLHAQAAAILAEGNVLSSFKHKGLKGIEREEPVRRFLRMHLPGRFHVGQGAVASAQIILEHQHDIIVADRDLCFMLLNTVSAQLLAIESVHLIVEVRSHLGELDDVAKSLRAVRQLQPTEGLLQLGKRGSEQGFSAPPVHTIIMYQGPKAETAIEHLNRVNAQEGKPGQRMAIDFILILAREGDRAPSSGYLIGYSRKDKATGCEFAHHYYPQVNEELMEGPKIIRSGPESFAYWYAALLHHLSGVTVYPPNLYSYLGGTITFVPWAKKPF